MFKVLTYDDEDDTASLDAESVTTNGGVATSTQTHLKHDKQKMEALKKIEKHINEDIKNIDDGG